ncbi:MAG: hypothetical protein ABIG42_07790 [bacterium]
MTDEEKIVEPEYDKDSLLDFSKGPIELESVKTAKSSDEKAADIQARIKELDKIIDEAKEAERGVEESIQFTSIEKTAEVISKPTPEIISKPTPEVIQKTAQKLEDKPLQAWEVDSYGRPLKGEKNSERDKTSYEIWLEEKRDTEGIEINCPKCGAFNIDIPFVSGEKCAHCGFNFDKGENIIKKMEARDVRSGKVTKSRISDLSPVNLKLSLELPVELVQNPDALFNCDYRSYSYVPYLLVGIAASIGFLIVMFGFLGTSLADFNFIFMLILLAVTIIAFHGMAKTLRVTRVVLDHEGVDFHGSNTVVRFNYENITAITNKRQPNGRAITMNLFACRYGFYPFLGRGYFYGNDFTNSLEYDTLDTSSNSPHYTNHVTVTSNTRSVMWIFSGSDNREFIRALAIVIFKARQMNNNCLVDIPALRAAEKTIDEYPDEY